MGLRSRRRSRSGRGIGGGRGTGTGLQFPEGRLDARLIPFLIAAGRQGDGLGFENFRDRALAFPFLAQRVDPLEIRR